MVGSDIVGRARSLRDALAVIRQHHERFDGSGYPDGLAREQISLAARIVAVVDVWDAVTSDRAYRAAWPPDRALRHLEAGRGSHFDPPLPGRLPVPDGRTRPPPRPPAR